MSYLNLFSNILDSLDNEHEFGLDIRMLKDTVDDANKKLEKTGVFIHVMSTGSGFVLKRKTVITYAKVLLVFFNPNKKAQFANPKIQNIIPGWLPVCKKYVLGLPVSRIETVLNEMQKTLGQLGIGFEYDSNLSVLSFLESPKVISMNADIIFKIKEDKHGL